MELDITPVSGALGAEVRGVDFGTKEQPKIATILFVVVLKEQQLAVLQEIAFFCSDMQNVRALSDAESVEEIQQILLAEE